jgi:hypothetical protein
MVPSLLSFLFCHSERERRILYALQNAWFAWFTRFFALAQNDNPVYLGLLNKFTNNLYAPGTPAGSSLKKAKDV